MRRFELLIFDWDGTLADSVGQIVSSMQAAIQALNLPPRADDCIAELIGLGFADGISRLYPELDTQDVLRLLGEYRQHAPPKGFLTPLFRDAAITLSGLRDAGYRLAIATGKPRIGLDRSLAHHPQLVPLFELSRCADETADKPDPLMLSEILSATGVAATQALMIGDTEYDIAMACALKMPALGVSCGVHAPARLLKAGAVAVIEGVHALPAWLNGSRELPR